MLEDWRLKSGGTEAGEEMGEEESLAGASVWCCFGGVCVSASVCVCVQRG